MIFLKRLEHWPTFVFTCVLQNLTIKCVSKFEHIKFQIFIIIYYTSFKTQFENSQVKHTHKKKQHDFSTHRIFEARYDFSNNGNTSNALSRFYFLSVNFLKHLFVGNTISLTKHIFQNTCFFAARFKFMIILAKHVSRQIIKII